MASVALPPELPPKTDVHRAGNIRRHEASIHDMKTSKIICSLCRHEIPASYLHVHREQESREIVDYTIGLIKARHPEWTENDPACQKCWEYYRNLPAS
jgi:hypothetical protein